jgi:hypothetical protein
MHMAETSNERMKTPEETIREAAEAYVSGDDEGLYRLLDDNVHMLGSEQHDNWDSRERSLARLGPELERRRTVARSVSGSLVDRATTPDEVHQSGDLAWWSGTGDLSVDGSYHRETSWTVVLSRKPDEESGGEWRIVHSHFSIHR